MGKVALIKNIAAAGTAAIITLVSIASASAVASVKMGMGLKVLHFMRAGNQTLLEINGGSNNGLIVGQQLAVYRPRRGFSSSSSNKIKTGEIKILHIEGQSAIAQVIQDGNELSNQVYGTLGGIMTGDYLEPKEFRFARQQMILPENSISYFDIFIDPKAYPATFELSQEGRAAISKLAQVYGDVRQPALLIEGHTDGHGPESANQIESYQRALTVRQYLIDELGFDATRIIAVGIGESEYTDALRVPGHERTLRRIVFKVVDSIPKDGWSPSTPL